MYLCFLIKNNNESIFCFSHKKWTVYRYKQNRQLSFLVKRDTKIVNLKVKAHEKRNSCSQNVKQIILMKKNGLNVEHFHYHIAINYDKNQHAFINQMLYQKKKCNQIMCSCDQLRKLVSKVWPVGRMSLEPCLWKHPLSLNMDTDFFMIQLLELWSMLCD